MITTCTPRRACVRHLARGVAGPSEGDPCGALDATDLRVVASALDEQIDLALTHQARALALVGMALAEQLAEVTARLAEAEEEAETNYGRMVDAQQERDALVARIDAVPADKAADAALGENTPSYVVTAATLAIREDRGRIRG